MLKLMKYEFRKQMMSKVIVFALVAVLEIIFLLGLIFSEENLAGVGAGFLVLVGMLGILYFSFESVVTFSNDLRTKQSYMLFLTPRNMFQVVGAKLVVTILQVLGAAFVFIAMTIGNVFLAAAKHGEISELIDVLKELVREMSGVEVRLSEILLAFSMVLVAWLVFIAMAFFSITLSTTLFANKKWKGVVSVVIFFALDWVVAKVASLFIKTEFLEGDYLVVSGEVWGFLAVYFVVLILDFLGTALLLEKKVSV